MKLVCVTKFTHSRVYTRVPVYRFTLQLLTCNLSSKFHFTMFWCLASGNLSIVFYSRLRIWCRRKESSRSLSLLLMSFLYYPAVRKIWHLFHMLCLIIKLYNQSAIYFSILFFFKISSTSVWLYIQVVPKTGPFLKVYNFFYVMT